MKEKVTFFLLSIIVVAAMVEIGFSINTLNRGYIPRQGALESSKLYFEASEVLEKAAGEINKLKEANRTLLISQKNLIDMVNFAIKPNGIRVDSVMYKKAVEFGLIPSEK